MKRVHLKLFFFSYFLLCFPFRTLPCLSRRTMFSVGQLSSAALTHLLILSSTLLRLDDDTLPFHSSSILHVLLSHCCLSVFKFFYTCLGYVLCWWAWELCVVNWKDTGMHTLRKVIEELESASSINYNHLIWSIQSYQRSRFSVIRSFPEVYVKIPSVTLSSV